MHGMRVASRVGTSVLLALTFCSPAAAQVCVAPAVERSLATCDGFSPAAPRRPGGGAGPAALPSAAPEVARDATTPRGPDLAPPDRLPGNREAVARQYRLLGRERQVLERLLGRMDRNDPQRADVLQRLATTLGELMTQDNARARRLDQPIFEARRDGDARELRRLRRAQREAEERVREEREAAIRAYAALVSDFPGHPRMDEALYTLALLLEELNQRQRARQVYHRLLRDHPDSRYVPHAYLAFAEFYFADGRLDAARQFYERVTSIPPERNDVYGYALYKLAWVRYNEEDFRGAMNDFVRVLEHARAYSDQPSSAALARQARREIVLPYAQVGRPDRALAFFRRVAQHDDEAFEMLGALAALYTDTGQWPETISVHHRLMSELPDSDDLCGWQVRVLEATIASRPKAEQVREAERLVDVRRAFAGGAHLSEAVDRCGQETATALLLLATAWHREAVGTDTQPGTRDQQTMRHASRLYDLLGEAFPNLERMELPRIDRRDRPSAARVALYQGDLLFELQRWSECATAFERALDRHPDAQLAADAAYGAVLCYDRHLGSRQPPETPDDEALSARDLTDEEQRMARTFHRFACSAPEHEELPVVLYRWARVHYEANRFAPAAVLFRRVATDFPRSEVGEYAANLWLESLNVLASRRNVGACFASIDAALGPLESRFCDTAERTAEHEELCTVILTVQCGRAAQRAERMAAEGEHARAARTLLANVTERHCPDPQPYLYNAALHFETARLLGRAIRVRSVLIENYAGHPLARRSIHLVGANYHALAIYEEAANWYEQYVREGGTCDPDDAPQPCPDPAEGLRYAVRFRLGLGQVDQALDGARTFQRTFGRSEPRDAANVAFDIGVVHERAGAWPRLVEHYRGFLRRHRRHATPAQIAAANVRVARGWLRQGDRDRAARSLEAAVRLHEEGGEDALAALDLDDETRGQQLVLLRDAVAEARYEIAESLRIEYERLRFPHLRGSATASRVNRWAERDFGPWVQEKLRLIHAAEEAYARVAPLGVPRWRIAAASRLGDMYYAFLEQVNGAPVPEVIRDDPELLDIYEQTLIRVTEEPRRLAIQRYESCLATATNVRWFDERSRRCERALNRLDAVRFPIASELRGAPDYSPDDGARPGATRLERPDADT